MGAILQRLLKNAHLRRSPHPLSLQRTSNVRLIPQDCLPDRQVKSAAGALHLGIFDQPKKMSFPTGSSLLTIWLVGKLGDILMLFKNIWKN
jgi:hypothetical protein